MHVAQGKATRGVDAPEPRRNDRIERDMAIATWRRIAAAGLTAASLAPGALADTPRPVRGAPGLRQVDVINHARHPIFQLRVSSSDADQWGDDRLGEAILRQGGAFRVRLGRMQDCSFDLQVIYDDLSHEERRAVDVCRTHAVVFDGSAAARPPEPFAVPHDIRLLNRAPRSIRQVFVSSASADQWGDDLIPSAPIAPGATGGLSYRGACVADLRIVYDNRAAEERRGIDLCATPALIIRPGWTTEDTPPAPPPPGMILLVNRTGMTITALRLQAEAPGAAETADLLGTQVLPPGQSLTVPFDRGGACRFTARAGFGGDAGEREQDAIDLCDDGVVVLLKTPASR